MDINQLGLDGFLFLAATGIFSGIVALVGRKVGQYILGQGKAAKSAIINAIKSTEFKDLVEHSFANAETALKDGSGDAKFAMVLSGICTWLSALIPGKIDDVFISSLIKPAIQAAYDEWKKNI